jgi:hypothetical protein
LPLTRAVRRIALVIMKIRKKNTHTRARALSRTTRRERGEDTHMRAYTARERGGAEETDRNKYTNQADMHLVASLSRTTQAMLQARKRCYFFNHHGALILT